MLLSPVTAPTALPTTALMAWTRSGCFSTHAFPLASRIRPFTYSPTPPARAPVAIFPPARELSSPPKMLWARIFSSLPSCQPFRAASSWMARFPTLLSSFTSSYFSWTFSLSKMVASFWRLFFVSLFSCFTGWICFSPSRMMTLPAEIPAFVVLSARPLTVLTTSG